jgi:hypothetical protein
MGKSILSAIISTIGSAPLPYLRHKKSNKISLSWCKKNAQGKPILLLVAVRRAEVYVPSQAFFIKQQKKQLNKKKAPDAPLHFQDEANHFI